MPANQWQSRAGLRGIREWTKSTKLLQITERSFDITITERFNISRKLSCTLIAKVPLGKLRHTNGGTVPNVAYPWSRTTGHRPQQWYWALKVTM